MEETEVSGTDPTTSSEPCTALASPAEPKSTPLSELPLSSKSEHDQDIPIDLIKMEIGPFKDLLSDVLNAGQIAEESEHLMGLLSEKYQRVCEELKVSEERHARSAYKPHFCTFN